MKRLTWLSRRTRAATGLALGVLGVLAFAHAVSAQAAPAVNIFDARCYRSITATDDLLCIGEFQLPQQTTAIPTPVAGAEAWCAQLFNQTGCSANPVAPVNPEGLIVGRAYVTLCDLTGLQDGCYSAATPGVLYAQQRIPRIHFGLTGVYLNPGHGITWDDADVNLCVESGTAFVPASNDCLAVDWATAANTQVAQRAELASDLPGLIADIAQRRSDQANTLLADDKLTTAGRILALEAYRFMDTVAPAAFQVVAIAPITTPFAAASTPSPLQVAISATATATAWVPPGAGALWGISDSFHALILFGGIGLIVAGIVYAWLGSVPVAMIALAPFIAIAMATGGISAAGIGVLLFLLAIPGGQFVLKKIGT